MITGPQLDVVEAPSLARDSPQTTNMPLTTATAPVSSTETLAKSHEPSDQSEPQTSGEGQHEEVQGAATTEPTDVTDQAKSDLTRSSGRSKKPTRFFGDPLRHSVKSVMESVSTEPSPQTPALEQTTTTPFVPIGRKGVQLPFPRTKEQATPFKRITIEEPENDLLIISCLTVRRCRLSTGAIVHYHSIPIRYSLKFMLR